MLKFKRILKRKIYPTWVSSRVGNCKAYVFEVPRDVSYFHYQISCDYDIQYASLADDVKFSTFEEACQAAEDWINKFS